MFTPAFVIAAVISLACLAVPVSIWVRMLTGGPRVCSQIHSRMSQLRREYHAADADADPARTVSNEVTR